MWNGPLHLMACKVLRAFVTTTGIWKRVASLSLVLQPGRIDLSNPTYLTQSPFSVYNPRIDFT